MKKGKLIISISALALCLMLTTSPALAADGTESERTKNETVYGMLNNDGSVKKVFVVNQLLGEYIDYGNYTEILNMSSTSVPTIDGDKITFPDENLYEGLFYQGTLEAELPMAFSIKYYLDGKKVSADDLAGASGELEIKIKYSINKKCIETVREGLTAQLSVTLDMGKASNIVAKDAVTFIAGNTMTINYTIMPDAEGTATLTADIKDFEMEPITINMMKSNFSGGIEDTINELQNGFDEMLDGADEMVDGSTELQEGMESLLDGVKNLYYGMAQLSDSTGTLESGMQSYKNGLVEYLNGVSSLGSGSDGIQTGLNSLATQGGTLSTGLGQIDSGLSALSTSSGDLKNLAQSLLGDDDPNVQALAQGMLDVLNNVDNLSAGLSSSNTGLTQYVAGVSRLASDYGTFNSGINGVADGASSLVSGYNDMFDGIKSFNDGVISGVDGIGELYYSIRSLPEDVQLLVDGQVEFKDGIAKANEEITEETSSFLGGDSTAVSFVSPEKNNVNSVQYIMMVDGIEKPNIEEAPTIVEEEETFWSRFLALFGF